MRTLAIVPARGGSKGIPNKNIMPIGGKPLMAHAIDVALKCLATGDLSRVVVSTDSAEYQRVALEWGAECPLLRPAAVSGDKAKAIEYLEHSLNFYARAGEFFDAVMILQPTSPLREPEDLRATLRMMADDPSAVSLISAYREDYVNQQVMYYLPDGRHGEPLDVQHNRGSARQDHGHVYVRNGCIYITRTEYLRSAQRVIGERPLVYVMPKWRSVNLDAPEDLELLRRLIS